MKRGINRNTNIRGLTIFHEQVNTIISEPMIEWVYAGWQETDTIAVTIKFNFEKSFGEQGEKDRRTRIIIVKHPATNILRVAHYLNNLVSQLSLIWSFLFTNANVSVISAPT